MTLNTTRPGFQLAFAALILMAAVGLHARERPYKHLLVEGGAQSKDAQVRRRIDMRRWEMWTTDANLLEAVALVASFGVVFGAMLFLNGRAAVAEGTLQLWAMEWIDGGVAVTVVGSTAFVVVTVVASTVLVRRTDVRKVRLKRQASKLERSQHRGSSTAYSNPLWKAKDVPGGRVSTAGGPPSPHPLTKTQLGHAAPCGGAKAAMSGWEQKKVYSV